jgi:hypothetical protein
MVPEYAQFFDSFPKRPPGTAEKYQLIERLPR